MTTQHPLDTTWSAQEVTRATQSARTALRTTATLILVVLPRSTS
jgi:hypothetical protein